MPRVDAVRGKVLRGVYCPRVAIGLTHSRSPRISRRRWMLLGLSERVEGD